MKGAVICTADAVERSHRDQCANCAACVIVIQLKRDGSKCMAQFDSGTQTYIRHVCGPCAEFQVAA